MSRSEAGVGDMSLFQIGDFTLASGVPSRWKIECDELTTNDWRALALMASEILPPFCLVFGVPRGGLPFEAALKEHATGNADDPVLICDDVWTTGGSLDRYVAERAKRMDPDWLGVVAFARRPIERPNIKALLTMGV